MTTVAADTREWTGDEIRDLRKRLRFNQEEFAELLGLSRSRSVGDLEKGRTRATGAVAVLLDLIDQYDGLPSRKADA